MTFDYPTFTPASGYMTDEARSQYIGWAVENELLPVNAQRMAPVISLTASNHIGTPIQFWQLYSVLGSQRIVDIVTQFYDRVFDDEDWFRSVFARISSKERHISTQSSMWVDVMGGGHTYHGGEFRLNFHHTHNAFELMNNRGAERWVMLMKSTLDDLPADFCKDPRVRPAINTFLAHFMSKYAEEFKFKREWIFGETNPPLKRALNLLRMSTEEIEALPDADLVEVLVQRGYELEQFTSREMLINKVLSL